MISNRFSAAYISANGSHGDSKRTSLRKVLGRKWIIPAERRRISGLSGRLVLNSVSDPQSVQRRTQAYQCFCSNKTSSLMKRLYICVGGTKGKWISSSTSAAVPSPEYPTSASLPCVIFLWLLFKDQLCHHFIELFRCALWFDQGSKFDVSSLSVVWQICRCYQSSFHIRRDDLGV